MEAKTKKRIIIGVASLAILGIAGYFGYKWWKNKKQQEEEERKRKVEEESSSSSSSQSSSSSTSTPQSQFTFPFKTVEEGNKFRKWVNDTYPAYAKQIDLSKEGKLNAFVEKAWKQYGTEYTNKVLSPQTGTSTPTSTGTTPTGVKPIYSKNIGTPVYKSVSDTIPHRLAGKGEYLGYTDGTIVKSYWGTPFYEIKYTMVNNKVVNTPNKYIAVADSTFEK